MSAPEYLPCPECEDGTTNDTCGDCGGSGDGHSWSDSSMCSTCKGSGAVDGPCERCDGTGRLEVGRLSDKELAEAGYRWTDEGIEALQP